MTLEERVDRLEHYRAAFMEERRQQRDEDRQLWRETERKVADTQGQLAELGVRVTQIAEEQREENRRLRDHIVDVDNRLAARIEGLASAVGQLIAGLGIRPKTE